MGKLRVGIFIVFIVFIFVAAKSGKDEDPIKKLYRKRKSASFQMTLPSPEKPVKIPAGVYRSYAEAYDEFRKSGAEGVTFIPSAQMVCSSARVLAEDFLLTAEIILNKGIQANSGGFQGVEKFYSRLFAKVGIERLLRPASHRELYNSALEYLAAGLILFSSRNDPPLKFPEEIKARLAERLRDFQESNRISHPPGFHGRQPAILAKYFFRDKFFDDNRLCVADDDELAIVMVLCGLVARDSKMAAEYEFLFSAMNGLATNYQFNLLDVLPIIRRKPVDYYLNPKCVAEFREELKKSERWVGLQEKWALQYPDEWTNMICFSLFPRMKSPDEVFFRQDIADSFVEIINYIRDGKITVSEFAADISGAIDSGLQKSRDAVSLISTARILALQPGIMPEARKLSIDRDYIRKVSGLAGAQSNPSTRPSARKAYSSSGEIIFSIEPAPSVYLRLAHGFRRLRDVSKNICSPKTWRIYSLVTASGVEVPVSPYEAVENFMYACYGLHFISCAELGIHHKVENGELTSDERARALDSAAKWSADFSGNYLIKADVRRSLKVGGNVNVSYAAARGVRLVSADIGFRTKQKTGKGEMNQAVSYVLPVEEWFEFVRPAKAAEFTRNEFVKICDRNSDLGTLKSELEKVQSVPPEKKLYFLIFGVVMTGLVFMIILWKMISDKPGKKPQN